MNYVIPFVAVAVVVVVVEVSALSYFDINL